ncbi:hypothetical protein FJ414_07625 [Mesorhizobium sp. B3-1-6]|uniref:2-keto-4-pentenoate hydratase n=1 Tax=Mesorhizobium sp. B3-1-6 TaxID=2589895 RepID=UPI0011279242|nr:fumarylacetoacetate hydrolase family protein [Mesorhizobium sp. B3-1-6]TPI41338.1 hypothetical protein FJ414_07625 [Mesorhizobium sp. B3-1-6]
MDRQAVEEAARLLILARRDRSLVDRLPPDSRPHSAAEAEAIQHAVVAGLGDRIAGWKVALSEEFGVMRGALLTSRVYATEARIPAVEMPGLCIEAEIAFRCDADLPPRREVYLRAEIEDKVTALVGMEVVDSRFRDAANVPAIERAADFMSNGGFVVGKVRADWRGRDFMALAASVIVNGEAVVDRKVGGLAPKDPVIPLVALVNTLRESTGLFRGQIVTTGTYSGVTRCSPGDTVQVVFDDFGDATVRFA